VPLWGGFGVMSQAGTFSSAVEFCYRPPVFKPLLPYRVRKKRERFKPTSDTRAYCWMVLACFLMLAVALLVCCVIMPHMAMPALHVLYGWFLYPRAMSPSVPPRKVDEVVLRMQGGGSNLDLSLRLRGGVNADVEAKEKARAELIRVFRLMVSTNLNSLVSYTFVSKIPQLAKVMRRLKSQADDQYKLDAFGLVFLNQVMTQMLESNAKVDEEESTNVQSSEGVEQACSTLGDIGVQTSLPAEDCVGVGLHTSSSPGRQRSRSPQRREERSPQRRNSPRREERSPQRHQSSSREEQFSRRRSSSWREYRSPERSYSSWREVREERSPQRHQSSSREAWREVRYDERGREQYARRPRFSPQRGRRDYSPPGRRRNDPPVGEGRGGFIWKPRRREAPTSDGVASTQPVHDDPQEWQQATAASAMDYKEPIAEATASAAPTGTWHRSTGRTMPHALEEGQGRRRELPPQVPLGEEMSIEDVKKALDSYVAYIQRNKVKLKGLDNRGMPLSEFVEHMRLFLMRGLASFKEEEKGDALRVRNIILPLVRRFILYPNACPGRTTTAEALQARRRAFSPVERAASNVWHVEGYPQKLLLETPIQKLAKLNKTVFRSREDAREYYFHELPDRIPNNYDDLDAEEAEAPAGYCDVMGGNYFVKGFDVQSLSLSQESKMQRGFYEFCKSCKFLQGEHRPSHPPATRMPAMLCIRRDLPNAFGEQECGSDCSPAATLTPSSTLDDFLANYLAAASLDAPVGFECSPLDAEPLFEWSLFGTIEPRAEGGFGAVLSESMGVRMREIGVVHHPEHLFQALQEIRLAATADFCTCVHLDVIRSLAIVKDAGVFLGQRDETHSVNWTLSHPNFKVMVDNERASPFVLHQLFLAHVFMGVVSGLDYLHKNNCFHLTIGLNSVRYKWGGPGGSVVGVLGDTSTLFRRESDNLDAVVASSTLRFADNCETRGWHRVSQLLAYDMLLLRCLLLQLCKPPFFLAEVAGELAKQVVLQMAFAPALEMAESLTTSYLARALEEQEASIVFVAERELQFTEWWTFIKELEQSGSCSQSAVVTQEDAAAAVLDAFDAYPSSPCAHGASVGATPPLRRTGASCSTPTPIVSGGTQAPPSTGHGCGPATECFSPARDIDEELIAVASTKADDAHIGSAMLDDEDLLRSSPMRLDAGGPPDSPMQVSPKARMGCEKCLACSAVGVFESGMCDECRILPDSPAVVEDLKSTPLSKCKACQAAGVLTGDLCQECFGLCLVAPHTPLSSGKDLSYFQLAPARWDLAVKFLGGKDLPDTARYAAVEVNNAMARLDARTGQTLHMVVVADSQAPEHILGAAWGDSQNLTGSFKIRNVVVSSSLRAQAPNAIMTLLEQLFLHSLSLLQSFDFRLVFRDQQVQDQLDSWFSKAANLARTYGFVATEVVRDSYPVLVVEVSKGTARPPPSLPHFSALIKDAGSACMDDSSVEVVSPFQPARGWRDPVAPAQWLREHGLPALHGVSGAIAPPTWLKEVKPQGKLRIKVRLFDALNSAFSCTLVGWIKAVFPQNEVLYHNCCTLPRGIEGNGPNSCSYEAASALASLLVHKNSWWSTRCGDRTQMEKVRSGNQHLVESGDTRMCSCHLEDLKTAMRADASVSHFLTGEEVLKLVEHYHSGAQSRLDTHNVHLNTSDKICLFIAQAAERYLSGASQQMSFELANMERLFLACVNTEAQGSSGLHWVALAFSFIWVPADPPKVRPFPATPAPPAETLYVRPADHKLRTMYGTTKLHCCDGSRYAYTFVPFNSTEVKVASEQAPASSLMLVWRFENNQYWRHVVVGPSGYQKLGRGLFMWNDDAEIDMFVGTYHGIVSPYASEAEADAAEADMALERRSYSMVCCRRGQWVVVDAYDDVNLFMRYVNSPHGLGINPNAEFDIRGQLFLLGPVVAYDIRKDHSSNSGSELFSLYGSDDSYFRMHA
jgi:hypothetical protein